MLNAEERAVYVKACVLEPLAAMRFTYNPETDFIKLVIAVRQNAMTMRGGQGFNVTYDEILEAFRVNRPAQYAVTVEMLVTRYIERLQRSRVIETPPPA